MYEQFKIQRTSRASQAREVILLSEDASKDRLSGGVASAVREARATGAFRGKAGEVVVWTEGMLLVGLGDDEQTAVERFRAAGAALVTKAFALQLSALRIHVTHILRATEAEDAGRAFGEGLGLAAWRPDAHDGTATRREPSRRGLRLDPDDAGFREGLHDGLLAAECVNEARRLAASPPNECNPAWFATEAKRLAKAVGLKVKVVTARQAENLGMGGLVGVGQGSETPSCMVVLEHDHEDAPEDEHLVFVGKTMTYDSGGYSLKVNNGMLGMKYDGCGGFGVLGAMLLIAQRDLPVRVSALLPCAENMVDSAAYRPDDIITMMNGATVEVTNTDAEGRLIMADALTYACTKLEPTAIVDMATLTGGIVVALGSWCGGMFCGDESLRHRLELSADDTEEKLWPMPVWECHRDFMRARHADLWNSGPKRDGHPIQGAAFLSHFVPEDMPWAHLDIAGVARTEGNAQFCEGPTGFGVRLLADLAAGYAELEA
ncbi:MAG: leucyl aminopeptidase family protein [Planctomycetota bacterium]|nr:leucyl aminopeptidase family protein [Planctomycetota bacterium]MED5321829.1 leucyl aminopeptidase family protein [Planctomycetota bacterium]